MKNHSNLRTVLSSTLICLGLYAMLPVQAQMCTREYAPVCGQMTGKTPQTFPNRCTLQHSQARHIADGECTLAHLPPSLPMPGSGSDAHGCKASAGYAWNAELASCIRPWMSSAITLEVAAQRRKCIGRIEMQCLMVRELQPDQKKTPWTPLMGEIEGYEHQSGRGQILRVRKDRHEDLPADSPSFTYKLIKTLY
jgi:hypothetical protein